MGQRGRPRKKDVEAAPVERATPAERDAPDARPSDDFSNFVETLTDETTVTCSLSRLPHYLTPQVSIPEKLPRPTFRPDLDAMQAEIRARYGPGHYKLWVRWEDPETHKRRMVAPDFVLAPGPEDQRQYEEIPPGVDGAPAGADDAIDDTLKRLSRAANIKAQATEIRALEAVAEGGGRGANPLESMKLVAELVRALVPAQADPLTLLKNARDILTPPGSAPAGSEMVGILKEVLGLARELGGGEGGGRPGTFLEVVAPHVVELLKGWGPYLPAMLTALRDARAGAPAPGANPPPVLTAPAAPVSLPTGNAADYTAILAAVGGDEKKAQRLNLLLDMALANIVGPDASGAPFEDGWPDGWEECANFADRHLPGMLNHLLSVSGDVVWDWWMRWDPRVLHYAAAPKWVRGFVEYVRALPEEPRAAGEGGGDE